MIYDFTKDVADFVEKKDEEAYYRIYEHSYLIARKRVQQYLKNPSDVEDVLQEIYLDVFQKLYQLKDTTKFVSWLYMICRNRCLDLISKQDTEKKHVDYMPEHSSDTDETGLDQLNIASYKKEYNPEAHVEALETKRLLDEIMDELPEKQRLVLLLWNEQMKYTEIAESLAMPIGSVSINCRRAKKTVEAKVRDLEKRGTKLYSMAPFVFFLWLLDQYDLLYLPDIPAKEVEAFYHKIQVEIGKLPSGAKAGISATEIAGMKAGTRITKAGIWKVIAGVLGITLIGGGAAVASLYPKIKESQSVSAQASVMPIHVEVPEIQKEADGAVEVVPESTEEQQTEASADVLEEQTVQPANKEETAKSQQQAKTNDSTKQAHVHTWETVPEQGHYETQVVQAAYDEPIYEARCVFPDGHTCATADEAGDYSVVTGMGYSVKKVQTGTKHHDAVTKQVWKVDSSAYTYCTGCGAKQEK